MNVPRPSPDDVIPFAPGRSVTDASVRAAIEELNARFAWSLDLQRWDDLRDVFTPDARYRSRGQEWVGRDDIAASFRRRTGERTTRHGFGSQLLTPVDASTVSGRSCWVTFAHNSPAPVPVVPPYQVADFLDVYALVEEHWYVAERVIVPVFHDAARAPV